MVIVGSLLILAVAIDAWRRMRQQQRSRVRVRLATDVPGDDPLDDIGQYRELPNGGARVVRREESTEKSLESLGLSTAESGKDASSASGSRDTESGGSAALAQAVGGSYSSRAGAASAGASAAEASAGTGAAVKDRTAARATATGLAGTGSTIEKAQGLGDAAERPAPESDTEVAVEPAATEDDFDETSPLAGVSARDDEPANLDWLEDLPTTEPAPEDEAGELPRQSDTEVIILHVMARDENGFSGQHILEILLACDLRFGDMDFFHRHEQQAGRGPIQFSVANMLQPGVFDIDKMDEMRTRGLVFFLTLPGPEDMILAFDCMLETARTVARNLGGELLDESRSVLTQQAVEHSRQQIRELDRRLRAREL